MTKRALNIRHTMLRCLSAAGDTPMVQSSLFDAVRQIVQPRSPDNELQVHLNGLESDGCVVGVFDDVLQLTTWTLTTAGKHAVAHLS